MTALPALTLWQPWASLIACGAKTIETRSWPPPAKLIGQRIAIHAAARPAPLFDIDHPAWHAIARALQCPVTSLPRGAVVASARLVAAYRSIKWRASEGDVVFGHDCRIGPHESRPLSGITLGPDERHFGDYRQGRWLWLFDDIQRLDPPVPARGAQGLWTWRPEMEPAS